MDISEIDGIGNETENKLRNVGINTTEDLLRVGWKQVAIVSHVGIGKISAIYNSIGIPVNENKIREFKKKEELNRINGRFGETRYSPRIKPPILDDDEEEDDFDFGDDEINDKARALAKFLDISPSEINVQNFDRYGMKTFEVGFGQYPDEYIVGTDEEADDAVHEAIEQSIWSFDAWFIEDHISSDFENIREEYEEENVNFQQALQLKEELEEMKGEAESLEDDIADKAEERDYIEELEKLNEELEELNEEIDIKENELSETGFDEDVHENDYSWENEYFDKLSSLGISGQSANEFLMEGKDLTNAIEEMQFSRSEDANDDLINMIEDIYEFVEDAISVYDRGHFLATYDGEENEVEVNGETYYIHRIN